MMIFVFFSISICYFRTPFRNGVMRYISKCSEGTNPSVFQNHPALVTHRTNTSAGLGTRLLSNPDRPHWPHRLHQHRHDLSRWLAVRFRRQRRYDHALGSQRIQASVQPKRRRRDSCLGLLAESLLALRRDVEQHHYL